MNEEEGGGGKTAGVAVAVGRKEEDVLEREAVDDDRGAQFVGEGDLAEGYPTEEGLEGGWRGGVISLWGGGKRGELTHVCNDRPHIRQVLIGHGDRIAQVVKVHFVLFVLIFDRLLCQEGLHEIWHDEWAMIDP